MQTYRLTVQQILDKQFNVNFKGYDAHEVDEFLDCVIHDYQVYDAKLKECAEKLMNYENKIECLNAQIRDLQSRLDTKEELPSSSNLDVLRRLARLEAEVFKK